MNTNNISIRQLQAFVEVALNGSFTRAAEGLHLTQSTLTAQIQQLEDQAGLKLFDRTTRRVLLTAEGERFLPVAERLLSDFNTAMTDLQSRAELKEGHVSLAGSPSVVTRLLPTALPLFRQTHPGIRVHIRDDSAGSLEQRVLNNEVDFAIAGNHSQQPDLEYEPILRDRYGLVVTRHHRLANATQLNWSQVPNDELLLLSGDTGIRAQLERFSASGQLSIKLDDAKIEATNPAGLAALIAQNLGVSVLPALAADTHSFEQLRFIPLLKPQLEREICIITRRGRALSPAAAALLASISEQLSQMKLPAGVQVCR
ncbi:LysR family transcriptional regulator [Marinobacterium lutimaris]|uniref:DNA-binding transcriptional regulator, LysR family n=1 Tax=Marinobacterium lutimaris TaxID=568106 RepID=A0A1H5WEG8_9GAMM|nr:LysR family transcriptional regulator [Marinobacterium lutimaris]SEF97646.1 DNA-binding transcriptional regulator, LysR family [Marinobacterium lutimaris]